MTPLSRMRRRDVVSFSALTQTAKRVTFRRLARCELNKSKVRKEDHAIGF